MPDPFTGLRPATLQEVSRYAAAARRERVAVGPTQSPTHWHYAIAGGEPVGFAGWMERGPGKGRIKGVYVFPEWRGFGYGDAMTAAIGNAAITAGVRDLDILSWEPGWALRNGFTAIGKNNHGAVHLRRLLQDGESLGRPHE